MLSVGSRNYQASGEIDASQVIQDEGTYNTMWMSGYDYSIGAPAPDILANVYRIEGMSAQDGYAVRFDGDSTFYLYSRTS